MTTQTTFRSRPYAGEADLQPLTDLLNACNSADDVEEYQSLVDTRRWMTGPDHDPAHDVRVWTDDVDQCIATGWMELPPPTDVREGYLRFNIHPAARNQGLEEAILAWAAARLCEAGQDQDLPLHFYADAYEEHAYKHAVLEREGFAPARYFFKMVGPLTDPIPEPQFPPGYTVRHVENDADVVAWVDAFNLSFIDHWGFHPITVERRRHRIAQNPYYRPELDLIAVGPDGTVGGFCACMINPEDNAQYQRSEGWIGTLGTRRGHRNIGLGRAMLLAGMLTLKAAGMDTAALGVDAENPTGALRLYESVGFYKDKSETVYRKVL